MRRYDESDMVRLLEEGDEEVMRMVFGNWYRALCAHAMRYVAGAEDAEDVVQEVLVSFWEGWKGRRFEGSVGAYLFGATGKAAMKHAERNGRVFLRDVERMAEEFWEEMTFDEEEAERVRGRLMREVEALPEGARKVFRAVVLEELSYKEAAEQLGLSVHTVHSQYSHAVKRLRERLGDLFTVMLLAI